MISSIYLSKDYYKKERSICCEDYSKIEGYEEAISSKKRYVLHHRKETRDEFGNFLDKPISSMKLQEMGLYYRRPAKELIFLSSSQHGLEHGYFDKNRIAVKCINTNECFLSLGEASRSMKNKGIIISAVRIKELCESSQIDEKTGLQFEFINS